MIYPALVVKIIGFRDTTGKINKKPIEGSNTISIQFDNGQVSDILLTPNNKDFNSLCSYLMLKAEQNVKENKVKSLSMELLFSENKYSSEINRIEEELVQGGKCTPAKAKQEAVFTVVRSALFGENLISAASSVRMAVAVDKSGNFNSMSILSKEKEGVTSYITSGIYNQSVLNNHIPIELSFITKSNGDLVDFLKVSSSTLINANQVLSLISHSRRTIDNALASNKKPFLITFNIIKNSAEIKTLTEYNAIAFKLKKEVKEFPNNPINIGVYSHLISLLGIIEKEISVKPSLCACFTIEIPLLLPLKTFEAGVTTVSDKGGSPIQILGNALVNLNFSKEDPSKKEYLRNIVRDQYISRLVLGEWKPKLLLTYNIQASTLLGDNSSWGFMHNNIDFQKLTLSKIAIDEIFNSLLEASKQEE